MTEPETFLQSITAVQLYCAALQSILNLQLMRTETYKLYGVIEAGVNVGSVSAENGVQDCKSNFHFLNGL